MNGKSQEFVYNDLNGDKISRLDWTIKNIPILNLKYEQNFENWGFSIRGRINLKRNQSGSFMRDYDWFTTPKDSNPIFLDGDFDTLQDAQDFNRQYLKDIGTIEQNPDTNKYDIFYAPTEATRAS